MFQMLFWLLVTIFLIVIDLITSSFIFMWFSIGALINILLAIFSIPFYIQIIVFFVVGIMMVLIGYPWVKRKLKASGQIFQTMEEKYIGMSFVADNDIKDLVRVKVGGIYWTATNKGAVIEKGDTYEIVGIDGNKLEIKLKEKKAC